MLAKLIFKFFEGETLKSMYFQSQPIMEDIVLQQTMIQMKHQQLLQQQLIEVGISQSEVQT